MAFDLGFNFRATAGYVTDPAYGVPVLNEAYPHTYTNGNGYSLNAGFTGPGAYAGADRNSSNDPRIAGRTYAGFSGSTNTFQMDLTSGSAPGAGDYDLDLAAGDDGNSASVLFRVTDGTTTFVDTGGTSIGVNAAHYLDATLTDIAASTTWTGTPVSISIGGTSAYLDINYNGAAAAGYSVIAHFRLTLEGEEPQAYTLTAETAMLSLSGQAATFAAQRRLTAEHAQIAMTGQVAQLRADRRLAAERALLTLSGQAATLTAARRLTADLAALTLTGQAATLRRGYTLTAETGVLHLAGQDASVRRAAVLLAERGLLHVRGQAATLRKAGTGSTFRQRRDTTQPFRRRWS